MVSLADPVFCESLDDLLTAAAIPSKRLMENVYVDSSLSPLSGQLATLGFAGGLFIFHYNEYRNLGYEVEIAVQAAQAQVLNHPVIQEGLARLMTQQVNKTVVNNG